MLRTVLFGFLLLLPLGTHGFHFHEIVRRDAKSKISWNYEDRTGPENWPAMFKDHCGGIRQSPINIVTSDVDKSDKLNDFKFINYDDAFEDAEIKNNGHTIEITPGSNEEARIIDEGGMDDTFQFLQLHFHWGSDSKRGSEHKIDGQSFPLEMHLVHRNTNYETKEQAESKNDGLAVLSVLFKLSDEDNPALQPIIDKLDDVRKEDAKAEMDDFTLESLLPKERMPYYRYAGSLTTPPCNEIVIWTIFKHHVPISEKQLQQFRNVKEKDDNEPEENLVNNFRPVQELHGRTVEVPEKKDDNSGSIMAPSMLMVLSAIAFFL